ncbi:MAG: hypothetical protein M1482_05840 [Chloroflexi bacterium]|nr:hypothetical protein [Chloroflexota bacterium]
MRVYDQVLDLLIPYFNSRIAAEQFLVRQCELHLSRKPDEVGAHDLVNLAKWAMVSGGLQVGKDKAIEISDKILALRRGMGEVAIRDRLREGEFTV